MNITTIVRGASAVVLVGLTLAVGHRAWNRPADVAPAPASDLPIADPNAAAPGGLYGRVTTYDGAVYEGALRFGGDEEAFWNHYFNGFKDENPWRAHLPPERLAERRDPIRILGIEIGRGERRVDLGRPFMARIGDVARIDAHGDGVWAAVEEGVDFDPDVRVTLKSGTAFDLDRLSAGDFDDGVRVWDPKRGPVDLGPRRIRSIEFLAAPASVARPAQLHGTVRTRGGTFTGFVQWNRTQSAEGDVLVGRTGAAELALRFADIAAIVPHGSEGALVTLHDGRDVLLSGTSDVGRGHRGLYVDDPRYGRVLVPWTAFERVDFTAAPNAPAYDDYAPGRPLAGRVTLRDGSRLAGRLVFDLDESETTETLDAPSQGIDYTLPFALVTSIVRPAPPAPVRLTLRGGETLSLEPRGDLAPDNAGLLVFPDGRPAPEYVAWSDVARIDFE